MTRISKMSRISKMRQSCCAYVSSRFLKCENCLLALTTPPIVINGSTKTKNREMALSIELHKKIIKMDTIFNVKFFLPNNGQNSSILHLFSLVQTLAILKMEVINQI